MSDRAERLKIELAALSPDERAILADFLLESLDESDVLDAAWDAELVRRANEVRSGQAVGEPAEQVFAELRRNYA